MPHGERRATTVNPFVGTQASTGEAGIGRCEEGGVPAADNSLGTGLPQRTREPSASPVVAQGVANAAVDVAGNAEEFQRGDWDYRHYGVYDRVTDQGWAKLEQLSERPTARELLTLPINALQALIKRAGMSHGAYDTKKTLSAQLVEWLVTHPDLVLALPLDRLRRGRRSRASSPVLARPTDGAPIAPGSPARAGRSTARQDPGPRNPRTANGAATEQPAANANAAEEVDAHDETMTDAGERDTGERSGSQGRANSRARGNRRENNARPLRAHRAASALRQTAGVALETLDAVAELMERVRLGAALSTVELRALEPKIAAGRAALRGVVAGFAAADLAAELTPAPESVRRPTLFTGRNDGALVSLWAWTVMDTALDGDRQVEMFLG